MANKLVVVDTSYLKDLCDPNEENFATLFAFHQQAQLNDTAFMVNGIVRQEFLKLVRKSLLIETMLRLSEGDKRIEQRYRAVTNIRINPLTPQNLNGTYERIYKDHVKQGDADLLLDALTTRCWHEVVLFEEKARIRFAGTSFLHTVNWPALDSLMQTTGMAPADALIAIFAYTIGADAILTSDCDYLAIAGSIDVYVPNKLASQCVTYSSALD